MSSAEKKGALQAFGISFSVFLLFFGGHYVMGDHTYRIAWAKAILDGKGTDISSYVSGATLSVYGIGHTLLHVPLLFLSRLFSQMIGVSCEGPLNMLLYVFNAAIGVVVFYFVLRRLGLEVRQSVARAVLVALATPWCAYSKLEYGEALVTPLLLAAWLLGTKYPLGSGLLGGLAVTIRPDALLWLPLCALFSTEDRKERALWALGSVPGLVLTAWGHWIRSGSLFSSGYGEGNTFSAPLYIGIYGLLFSAGKSVFLYAPLLLAYGFALRAAWHDPAKKSFAKATLALALGQLLLYARWWDWSGDDAWGPRFMILSMMACSLLVAAHQGVGKRLFSGLVALGLVVQMPAVLLGPHTSLMLTHLKQPRRFHYVTGASIVDIEDMRFHPAFSPVRANFELLRMKLGWKCTSSDPRFSAWVNNFSPELSSDDIPWDIFWVQWDRLRNRKKNPAEPSGAG